MIGDIFSTPKKWRFVYIQSLAMGAALACGLFLGPGWMARLGLVGLFVAVVSFLVSWRRPRVYPPQTWSVGLGSGFLAILLAAIILEQIFLKPLSDEKLQLPRFNVPLKTALYAMKGPAGWKATRKFAVSELGFLFQPDSQASYMGISEARVVVRVTENPIKNPAAFLLDMASRLQSTKRPPGKGTVFKVTTEPVTFFSGEPGVFAIFEVKRFWVPIKYISLFRIREGRYLCVASTVGLSAHATLSKVFCQGLMESIKIMPQTPESILKSQRP